MKITLNVEVEAFGHIKDWRKTSKLSDSYLSKSEIVQVVNHYLSEYNQSPAFSNLSINNNFGYVQIHKINISEDEK